MAAPNTTSLDTVITVKVNFENVTRRVKMPLRDTTPQLLEKQVCNDSSNLQFLPTRHDPWQQPLLEVLPVGNHHSNFVLVD